MTPRDWTLLVIAAAGGKPLKPVQLQKALFVLGRKLPAHQLQTEHFYHFDAYDYGPFTSEIYTDAEALESVGLIHIARPPATRYKEYQATDAGLKRAAELRPTLHPATVDYLARVVKFTGNMSFNDLVSAIYKAFPDMRMNSVFKE